MESRSFEMARSAAVSDYDLRHYEKRTGQDKSAIFYQ